MSYFNDIRYQGSFGYGPRNLNGMNFNGMNNVGGIFNDPLMNSMMGLDNEFDMMGGMCNQAEMMALMMMIGLMMCMSSQYSGLDSMNYMNNWAQCCMPQQCMPQQCMPQAQQTQNAPQAQPQNPYFSAMYEKTKPSVLSRVAKSISLGVGGAAKGAGSAVWGVAKAPFTVAKGILWDPTANICKGFYNGFKHIAQGQVAEGLGDMGGGIAKGIASPFTGVYKAVTDIGEGFVNGAKSFFKGQVDAFMTLFN